MAGRSVKQQLKIQSRTEQLTKVRDFVSDAARGFGFAEDDVSKIALAVDEACTNIIKHAYQSTPGKEITISITGEDDAFQIRIVDNGRRFDPSTVENPDMPEYLSHYRKGGLGVYLIRSLMDKVEYGTASRQQNEVRLTKYRER
jgi:serine/threonine-protein kinase RsbW